MPNYGRIPSGRLEIDDDGAAGLAELAVRNDGSEIVEFLEQQIVEAIRLIGEPDVNEHPALTVERRRER